MALIWLFACCVAHFFTGSLVVVVVTHFSHTVDDDDVVSHHCLLFLTASDSASFRSFHWVSGVVEMLFPMSLCSVSSACIRGEGVRLVLSSSVGLC